MLRLGDLVAARLLTLADLYTDPAWSLMVVWASCKSGRYDLTPCCGSLLALEGSSYHPKARSPLGVTSWMLDFAFRKRPEAVLTE